MKTKLIILTAAAAVLLYSCSSDRDETTPVAEKTKPELKLNPGQMSRETVESKKDTIIITRDLLNNGPADPTDPIDPSEGGDPKDVPPRK